MHPMMDSETESDQEPDPRPDFASTFGCWLAGALFVVVVGIGVVYYTRWNNEHVEAVRSRSATIELLKLLGGHAMLDYIDAHECLPNNVGDLVPYLDLFSRGSTTAAVYREDLERGLDACGNELRMYMDTEARRVILISAGPDGYENNSDDVVFVERLPQLPRCPESPEMTE
jgi:hypothetical protein